MSPLQKARRASVHALRTLLETAAEDGGAAKQDTELISRIGTQRGLAKLAYPEKSIGPMSLNTLKSLADHELVGGFAALDELRLKVLKASLPPASLAEDPQERAQTALVDFAESERILLQDLANMGDALNLAIECARKYAKMCGTPLALDRFAEDEAEIIMRASLTRRMYLAKG